MKNVLLVKYGEIAMRGKNRHLFEYKLIDILKKKVELHGKYYVIREQGRFLIENQDGDVDYDVIIPEVLTTLGVVAVCLGVKIDDQSLENLQKEALTFMQNNYQDEKFTFKVDTKRASKNYPLKSQEISSEIGAYLLENMEGLRVDVHNPQVRLNVEIRNSAYLFSKMIKGWGGLPVGSSGKGIVLLSGGIDSPVAAFLMAKRGVALEAVYFHSPPYTSERAKQKVIDLAEQIAVYTGGIKLHVIPFTDLQIILKDRVPPQKLTILLKRAMIRTAEKIAKEIQAQALILGDSIGQVASQTMHSIHAIDSSATMPLLRPLASFDKQEIVDLAKKIGTFEISIRPYEDCCTIFLADHPETKPKASIIESIESKIENLDEMIGLAIENREVIEI